MATKETKTESVIDQLAEASGVAIVVLDKSGTERVAANNNSICTNLYPSAEFGPRCAEFCGRALARSSESGGVIEYRCHAGLDCKALAVKKGNRELVTIFGRTFSSSDAYRQATERAVEGDWRSFPARSFFENVIISTSPTRIEALERQIGELDKELIGDIGSTKTAKSEPKEEPRSVNADVTVPGGDPFESSLLNYKIDRTPETKESAADPFESSMVNVKLEPTATSAATDIADREAWRAFIPSLLKVSYKLACRRILEFLARHYGIESSLWLQLDGSEFEMASTFGEFENRPVRVALSADDKRVRAAARDDSPIVLREAGDATKKKRTIYLFPVVIGGEVRNALGVERDDMDTEFSGRIIKFCRYVASRLEILRLREAVAIRERRTRIIREFGEQLRSVEPENFWTSLTNVSAQLLGAERASLLLLEPSERLVAKASVGAPEDISLDTELGSRVARTILQSGEPVLVEDVTKSSLSPAPDARRYFSPSFISYPITFGGEPLAVMNFTNKSDGEVFDKNDLDILDSISPQIAVAVDRMTLQEKIGEFAQLSITDALTGLLNRRYIEERLVEEINRSGRSSDPLSVLLLDVDEFKSYNDRFGHPAGDEALRIVGAILKETVRGADVAARYGGEEFAILLPETASSEAKVIAERIRSHVEQTEFPHRKVTVSIGVATYSDGLSNGADLISAADKALYAAKGKGRNNVQIFDAAIDAGDQVH